MIDFSATKQRRRLDKRGGFKGLKEMLGRFDQAKDKYYSREWQSFGIHLTKELGDAKHKSLYMKMARDYPRAVLEQALRFVSDSKARNKGALFMWKAKELVGEQDGSSVTADKQKQQEGTEKQKAGGQLGFGL
jgi:hypothetical protein